MKAGVVIRQVMQLSLTVVLFTMCGREGCEVTYYDSASYVNQYVLVHRTMFDVRQDKGEVALTFHFTPLASVGIMSRDANDENYKRYIGICERHEDMGFHREVGYLMGFEFGVFYDVDPVRIEVTSDADWDEEHPAGSQLGDIAVLNATTPYPFIKNGYTGEEVTRIQKTLSEVTAEDMVLTYPSTGNYMCTAGEISHENMCIPYITFKTKPEVEKRHGLTVKLTDAYERVYEGKCVVVFE